MQEISADILKTIYKPRDSQAHKYDFGSLLVIGGSKLYHGSPTFNAMAAYKCGVDLVTVAAPKRAADFVAAFSPNLVTYPLEGDCFSQKHIKEILGLLKGKTAMVIGGGMCREKPILDAITKLLKKTSLPTVIDADAIHALIGNEKILKNKPFVLTPHAYEFHVLTGQIPPGEIEERIKLVKEVALKLQTTIILKGKIDIISDGQKVTLNKTGNPYMTVGGTGDTLAGILGSLLAQRLPEFDAACAAAYINGAAGDLAAAQLGPGMLASDLVENIPEIIMSAIQ